MADYILVIPSYKRASTLHRLTMSYLKTTDIFNYVRPIVWCNTPEEVEEYKALDFDCDYNTGGSSISEVRNLIQDSYPLDSKIVMIDDDINFIATINKSGKKEKVKNLHALITYAFNQLMQQQSSFWGVYPIDNPLCMSANLRTNLCYVNGSFFGIINKRISVETNYAEDYERSIKHWIAEGKLLRLEFIGLSTKYYKEQGGLQETRTPENNTSHKQRLVDLFPQHVKLVQRRGKTELSFIGSAKQKSLHSVDYLRNTKNKFNH